MKKKTNKETKLLALSKEEKPGLVLYQALNCLLKHSIKLFEMSSLTSGKSFSVLKSEKSTKKHLLNHRADRSISSVSYFCRSNR